MPYKNILQIITALVILAPPVCHAQGDAEGSRWNWKEVSGTGIHYFDDQPGRNVIVHEVVPTETGVVQRSTETIDLFGDLQGRVLYQPVTVIDNGAGKLVNTGNQVFSGTVLGIGPVLLHDEIFRFDVNLQTGETLGRVFLIDRIDGPSVVCVLEIVGTGFDESGNGLAEYSGFCRLPRKDRLEDDSPWSIEE
jgi:hypothetical protein